MTDRKFYKTKISFVVISEEPIPDGMNVQAIANEAIEGGYSMGELTTKETELNGIQTAKALIKQGSDPEFFSIDAAGDDADF